MNSPFMPLQSAEFLSSRHRPKLDGGIAAPRGQSPAVRRKSQRINPGLMTLQCPDFLAGFQIPQCNQLISTSRRKQFSVWADGHRLNAAGMTQQGARLPWGYIPQFGLPSVP